MKVLEIDKVIQAHTDASGKACKLPRKKKTFAGCNEGERKLSIGISFGRGTGGGKRVRVNRSCKL